MADNFDFFLSKNGFPESKRVALSVVADTMFMAMMWLRQNKLPETMEDMARFTDLVLRYEIEHERLALEEERNTHLIRDDD